MDLTSKKVLIFRRVDPLLLVRQTLHRLGGTQKRFCGALKEQLGEANVALHSASVFGEADAPIVVELAQKPDSGLRAR